MQTVIQRLFRTTGEVLPLIGGVVPRITNAGSGTGRGIDGIGGGQFVPDGAGAARFRSVLVRLPC